MATPTAHNDGPVTPPVDTAEERERLLNDVASLDLAEQGDALRLVGQISHVMALPEAYRAVDRRLASGYTVDEAQHILQGDLDPPTSPASEDDSGAEGDDPRAAS